MIESQLSFAQSLFISLNGLIVVFSVLVILSLATIVIAKIVSVATSGNERASVTKQVISDVPASRSVPDTPSEDEMGDVLAVLQGALSMETGIPIDKLIITSVTSCHDGQ